MEMTNIKRDFYEFKDKSGYSALCNRGGHNFCKRTVPVKRTGKLCTCVCHEDDK